jgi:hypothetical protein
MVYVCGLLHFLAKQDKHENGRDTAGFYVRFWDKAENG